MNCLYCNQLCSVVGGLDYTCKKCPGEPIFANWDEELIFNETVVTVTFVINDHKDYLDFNPATQKIFIDSLMRHFDVNFIVTPDNVCETYERFLKLAIFS